MSALDRARALRDGLIRAEAMIGLISLDEARQLPALYAEAAAGGAPGAWRELGDCWAMGLDVLGQDLAKARACYARALDAGDPEAPEALAKLVLRGDPGAGPAAWAALAPGVAAGQPRASLFASYLRTRGAGVAPDPEAALALARVAAEGGLPEGMFEVHVLLRRRDGPSAEALEWCARAAARGHARALFNRAVFAAIGEGEPADLALARARYAEAAEAGSAQAAHNLACMLRDGEGGPVDLGAAARWAALAAEGGLPVWGFGDGDEE